MTNETSTGGMSRRRLLAYAAATPTLAVVVHLADAVAGPDGATPADAQLSDIVDSQIMAAVALLAENPHPTDADIDAIENVCRCGTYVRIRRAIHRAAGS